ncbi:MAG TPA: carboxylating nicotinate-nucleotide diphosphorylase [Gammaproteobacteria bacterium]|nr:carboxylating nicotinate-nucleotide diphosphorylase [Gammaproteobacteria bacterium]
MDAPPADVVAADVDRALAEDLGDGDLTAGLVPAGLVARASIVCREQAVLCGAAWAEAVFAALDPRIRIEWLLDDGAAVAPDQQIGRLRGPARGILGGERVALNFLQLLSGTATTTRAWADAIAGTGCTLLDTRKTLPGLRAAQKYAVRCGGGRNHRMGLYDAVLIKENHIAAAGGIAEALAGARRAAAGLDVEIEVENLDQLDEAMRAGARRVLIDNFTPGALRRAVQLARDFGAAHGSRVELEASGGVDLGAVRGIAESGVDFISAGALTKHVRAIDLSLRFAPGG